MVHLGIPEDFRGASRAANVLGSDPPPGWRQQATTYHSLSGQLHWPSSLGIQSLDRFDMARILSASSLLRYSYMLLCELKHKTRNISYPFAATVLDAEVRLGHAEHGVTGVGVDLSTADCGNVDRSRS